MNRISTGAVIAAATLVVLLTGGCASRNRASADARDDGYLSQRARDAADCLTLTLSAGPELSADFKATEALHLMVGGGFHAEAGVIKGDLGTGTAMSIGLPLSPFLDGGVMYRRLGMFFITDAWTVNHLTDECYGIHALGLPPTSPDRPLIDRFDLEFGAVVLLGARVGFSPGQFLDFVLGLLGVDLAGDDPLPAPADDEETTR